MAFMHALRPTLVFAGLGISVLGGLLATEASAQALKVATAYKLMTLDPHYADLNENTSLLSHIFERLVYQDEKMEPKPGLAVSWKPVSYTHLDVYKRQDWRRSPRPMPEWSLAAQAAAFS